MFWENFVLLCNKKGMSPNGVCAELGFSVATATKWKKGAAPRDTTLRRIAEYFGVPTDYFFTDNNEVLPETNSQPNINNVETTDIAVQIKKYLEEQKLSEAEKTLLDLFRLIPENQQQLVIQMIRAALGR